MVKRFATSAVTSWAWNAANREATLTFAANTTLPSQGLRVGQGVRIGSIIASGANAGQVQNGLTSTGGQANDMSGYAQVKSISTTGNVIVFVNVDAGLQQNSGTNSVTPMDLLFSVGLHNPEPLDSEFIDTSYSVEGRFLNPETSSTLYRYGNGLKCNTLALNFPTRQNAGMSFGFIGQNVETTATADTNFATPFEEVYESPLATSVDTVDFTLRHLDGREIDARFLTANINISNNYTPGNIIGKPFPDFYNQGQFVVGVSGTIVFDDEEIITSNEGNCQVALEMVMENDEGAWLLYMPALTFQSTPLGYPNDQAMTVAFTAQGTKTNEFGTTLFISDIRSPMKQVIC